MTPFYDPGSAAWWERVPVVMPANAVLRQFTNNSSTLVELRDKLLQEPPSIVGITQKEVMLNDTSNWVPPEKAGFSDSHFLEYRALMDKAHIKELWSDEGVINFGIAGFGFAGSGWRLSFAYTKTPPPSLISSIDSLPKHSSGNPSVEYRALGNNWYIRIYY
jgi:hypothetical protein